MLGVQLDLEGEEVGQIHAAGLLKTMERFSAGRNEAEVDVLGRPAAREAKLEDQAPLGG